MENQKSKRTEEVPILLSSNRIQEKCPRMTASKTEKERDGKEALTCRLHRGRKTSRGETSERRRGRNPLSSSSAAAVAVGTA
jgi:hypothetical protein